MFISRPAPPLTGHSADFVTSFDQWPFVNDCSQYRAVVTNHPVVADAMQFTNLDFAERSAIWQAFDDAVGTGFVAAVTAPADIANTTTDVTYTRQEALDSYSAKVAHCFWLEVNKVFPWSLQSFDVVQLSGLLWTDALFENPYDTPAWSVAGAEQLYFCDHSPKDCYDQAVSFGATTANSSIDFLSKMYAWFSDTFIHGIDTISQARTFAEFLSDGFTGGCFGASHLVEGICRSVNIPAEVYRGLWISGGHVNVGSFVSRTEGRVLFHGDHVTSDEYRELPNVRRAELYSVYKTLVLDEPDADVAYYESGRLSGIRTAGWISDFVRDKFPYIDEPRTDIIGQASGWSYMLSQTGGKFTWGYAYLTPEESNNAYLQLSTELMDTGLCEKPNATNSGPIGALTPVSGPVVINQAWVDANGSVYENMDVTGGGIVLDADLLSSTTLQIKNCKIDANGGIGIDIQGVFLPEIWTCEISNCTVGINGTPFKVIRSYIHGFSSSGMLLNNDFMGNIDQGWYFGNLIEATGTAVPVNITTGPTAIIFDFMANTITGAGTGSLFFINGSPVGSIAIARNWIDGGSWCVFANFTSSDGLFITHNKFGRSSTAGLYNNTSGPTADWYMNTYEDDGTEALFNHTAPL